MRHHVQLSCTDGHAHTDFTSPPPGDATPHWYEFPFDGTTGAFINLNLVTLHFVDGQRGDDDLTENGVIVDAGGPMIAPADLSLTHTDSPDPAHVGEPVTYSIVVTNNGPSRATEVVLTDTLPANTAFTSATTTQGICAEALGTVTCDLGDIDDSASATVEISLTPEEPAGATTITNTASVGGTQGDPDTDNNSAIEPTVINHQADSSVTMTSSPDPVLVGQPLVYTAVITNNGPSQTTSVVLTDPLPANVTFDSVVTSQGSCAHVAGTVTCSLGTLDNGATASVVITVIPPVAAGGSTIANSASVTSDVSDFNPANDNVAESTVVLPSADLAVTQSDTPDPVPIGSTVTYSVVVTNNGPSLATGATLTDTLPNNATLESAGTTQGNCSQSSGTLTCELGAIVAGDSATVSITVRPNNAASKTVVNAATVNGVEADPVGANDTATETTTISPIADLLLTSAAAPDPVQVGGILTYTLTVTNIGPSAATGVELVDILPVDVSFVSAAPSQGTCGGTTIVTCNLGTIAAGGRSIATIFVTVLEPGTLGNGASVSANESDPNNVNNVAAVTTTVVVEEVTEDTEDTDETDDTDDTDDGGTTEKRDDSPAEAAATTSTSFADLALTMIEGADPVSLGADLTYTLTVVNHGPRRAIDILLTDTLPDGVTVKSVRATQGAGCYPTESTVLCLLGDLDVDGSATVTIVIAPAHAGSITNAAGVVSSQVDPEPGDNTAGATTTVSPAADLSVAISHSPGQVVLDGNLSYTLAVTNSGPSEAPEVSLINTLPGNVTFVSASAECREVAGTVACDLGRLASGASVSVVIVVTPTAVGEAVNAASVASSVFDPTPGNNSASSTTMVSSPTIVGADLAVVIAHSPSPALLGSHLTYTFTVTNSGPFDASGVVLTDVLPETVSFVSASASCTVVAGQVICELGDLADGAQVIVEIVVIPNAIGDLVNVATVAANESSPEASAERADDRITVSPAADLSLVKTNSPNPVPVASNLTYKLTVTNSGPSVARAVKLIDTLPGTVSFVSATADCAEVVGVLTCDLGDLASGATELVTIVVTTNAPGGLINTAIVTSGIPDPNPANNSSFKTTTVSPAADLSVAMTHSPSLGLLKSNISYTLTVTNSGPSDASGVILTDTLPGTVSFVSASADCSEAAGLVTCDLGDLASGGQALVTIVVSPDVIGDLVNVADLTSDVADPRPENNSASKTTNVSPSADLSVGIALSSDRAVFGSNLSYTVTVTNSGPSDASQVVLTNRLPVDGRLVRSTGRCTDADGAVICDIGSIESGASSTVAIYVNSRTRISTSTVSVTAAEIDPIVEDNTAAETFLFRSRTSVVILLPDSAPAQVPEPVTRSVPTPVPTPVPDFDVDQPVVPPFELPAPEQAPAADDGGGSNLRLLMLLAVALSAGIGLYLRRARGRRGKDPED